MTPEHEWARMCETPLADDSGLPTHIAPTTRPFPKRSRDEVIKEYRERYALFIGIARDDYGERARIMAYECAISCIEELALLGVTPYPVNLRSVDDRGD